MTQHSPTLDVYQSIAQASSDMLLAARDGDWDSLGHAGREVERLIQNLRQSSTANSGLNGLQQRQRWQLLKCILADDAEIRDLTEPWTVKLEMLTNTRRRNRR